MLVLLFHALRGLYFACGEADNQVGIVGLHLRLVGGFVARDFATTVTAVDENITALWVGECADGAENATTGVGAVTRENVYVQRAEAEGAMVARGVAKRENLLATVLAGEATIVFLKSFLLHSESPFVFLYRVKICVGRRWSYLPTQNFAKMSATTSSLTRLPSTSPSAPMASSTSLEAQSA